MGKAQKITKDMTIDEVIQKNPKATSVFLGYEHHCVGCPMSQEETIEQFAQSIQIDLKKLLEELNKAV